MVRVNSKVVDLSTRSTVGCVKKVVCILQSLQSPNSAPFCSLALFIPFPSNHVTGQPIGPWVYGRAGPNRKAHLVPLIAITGGRKWSMFKQCKVINTMTSFNYFQSNPSALYYLPLIKY